MMREVERPVKRRICRGRAWVSAMLKDWCERYGYVCRPRGLQVLFFVENPDFPNRVYLVAPAGSKFEQIAKKAKYIMERINTALRHGEVKTMRFDPDDGIREYSPETEPELLWRTKNRDGLNEGGILVTEEQLKRRREAMCGLEDRLFVDAKGNVKGKKVKHVESEKQK